MWEYSREGSRRFMASERRLYPGAWMFGKFSCDCDSGHSPAMFFICKWKGPNFPYIFQNSCLKTASLWHRYTEALEYIYIYKYVYGDILFQKTTYVWQQPLQCYGGVALPAQTVSACVSLDFWLKFGVTTGIVAAVLLISISCYFWKKTRKWDRWASRLLWSLLK